MRWQTPKEPRPPSVRRDKSWIRRPAAAVVPARSCLRHELAGVIEIGFPEAGLRRQRLKAEFALGSGPPLSRPHHEELGLGVVVLDIYDFPSPQPVPHSVEQDSAIADIGHAGNLRKRPAIHVQSPDPDGERCRDSRLTVAVHGEEMVCDLVLPAKVTAVSGQCSGVIYSGHLVT